MQINSILSAGTETGTRTFQITDGAFTEAVTEAVLQAYNFIKKRLQHRCFPEIFAKFLKHLLCRTSANDYSSL